MISRVISKLILTPLRVAYVSMIVSIVLAVIGVWLGLMEGSLVVRTNGFIAAIDILNSIVLVAAINRSIRSPDYVFNYGYGKYESLALLSSTMLLMITLMFTIVQAYTEYTSSGVVSNFSLLISFNVVSIISMLSLSWLVSKSAKRYDLPILHYDSDVWRIDSYIELIVLVSLSLGWLLSNQGSSNLQKVVDVSSALVILLVALRIPFRHGAKALNQLLDKTLPDEIQFDIIAVVAENFTNFCEFRSVHTRQSGKDIFVEIDVVMPFDYTFEQAYPLEQSITKGIQKKYPNAISRIYAVPCKRDCIRDGKCFCPLKQSKQAKEE